MVLVLSELKLFLGLIDIKKENSVVYIKNLEDDEYYTIETVRVDDENDIVLDIKYSTV